MAERNFENRTLFQGDNLPFLRGLASESVDLIATDPPFNKGKDFHATPDSLAAGAAFEDRWRWDKDVQPDWLASIRGGDENLRAVWQVVDAAYGASGEDMAAFLCWLGVRLIEMRRLLSPTGSIYLQCDPTAGHYIKALMDAIFGRRNFRNEIVWHYGKVANSNANKFLRGHDLIFFYTKGKKATFTRLFEDTLSERKQQLIASGYNTKNQAGQRYLYIYDENRVREREAAGKLDRNDFDIVRYVDTSRGNAITDIWPIDHLNSQAHENVGYPTQKPLALYERIIKASSNPGDMVLDPFCGCATTPIAAELEGRRWVGMDLWDGAYDVVVERLQKEVRLQNPEARIDYRVRHVITPPVRPADDHGEAVPFLTTPKGRKRERPSDKAKIRRTLEEAQRGKVGVVCAGCGVDLHTRYFALDHREPSSGSGKDEIANRVLLCSPCNNRKSNRLTVIGLRNELRKAGEMTSLAAAEDADARAQEAARNG